MSDTPTTSVELARPLDELREQPETIADAIERAARIDTLRDWLSDLRDDVRNGYVETQAQTIEQATGGSFNAPVKGTGTAYRTQPQPTPSIVDAEAFARWYVETLLEDDPDRDASTALVRFDDHVGRRLVATADSSALLAFVNGMAAARAASSTPSALEGQSFPYADALVDAVAVDVEWLASDATLEAMIKGDAHALDEKRARLVVDKKALTCTDRETGERVPGVVVKPARPGVLTIKPDTEFKKRLRGELDELLGPPALRE